MYTFLESPKMALALGAVRKDDEKERLDSKGVKKHVSLVYGLFEPQSGGSPE